MAKPTDEGVSERSNQQRPSRLRRISANQALILLLLVSAAVRLSLAPVVMNRNDRRNFIGAANKTLRYGVASIYHKRRDYEPKRRVNLPYPPVLVYVYAALGWSYDRLYDPSFKEVNTLLDLPFDSVAFSYLIKLPIFLFELMLMAVIFLFVRRRHGEWTGLVCSALYGLNPAVLYDSALWAQPDAVHSAFLALAVVFMIEKRGVLSLSCLTLALLSKPQAAMAAPLIVIYLLTTQTLRQSFRAILAAAATASVLFIPFLVQNTSAITEMVQTISKRDPYVSGNAHNLWWFLLSIAGIDGKIKDSTELFAGLSYSVVSLVLLVVLYTVAARVLIKTHSPLTAEPVAYICLLVFVFAVRMHENHSLQILPILLLSGLALRHQRIIFGTLSITILANMALHSPEIVGYEGNAFASAAGVLNSGLNVAILAYWSWELFWRRRGTANAAPLPEGNVPENPGATNSSGQLQTEGK
jgi:Gpi18-like mannosyltransferase